MKITQITNTEAKTTITTKILTALPNWFGIPESTQEYIHGVADKPFIAAYDGDEAVGFVSLLTHNAHTAEIYVMGILESHHRKGIGRQLVQACEDYCTANGLRVLTVKTLDASHPDEYYKRTRLFYETVGFIPLETFPTLWDASNPCLFLAKFV